MIQRTYLKSKDLCKVKFTSKFEGAEKVELAGLNGDWQNPVEMERKKNGNFVYVTSLPKNSYHEFKYLVNGSEWRNEVDADGESSNEYGGTNSILQI